MNDRNERYLTWFLVAFLVLSVLGTVYLSATPAQRTDPYTELYVEGPDGNASDYPQRLSVGESGNVTVGVSNHENRWMQYTLVYRLGAEQIGKQTISIEGEESWEGKRSFTPKEPGRKQLQIHLYRGAQPPPNADPYRTVYLWVSVRET